MAVYNHEYKLYKGPFTPVNARFLIIPRYAFKRVFSSKLFTGFYALCFLPLLIFGILIYLLHNASLLELLEVGKGFLKVDASLFLTIVYIQTGTAFLITLFLGPPLVSPDLSNNALPLYLSRPFERRDYVLGKFSVIYITISAITWVSSILLFALQAYLAEGEWFWSNKRILVGIFLGTHVYIITLTLVALALSAWLKWKTIAGFAFIALPIIAAGMGAALNATLHSSWGSYLDIFQVLDTLTTFFFGLPNTNAVSLGGSFFILGLIWACALILLRARIKAYEVIK